MAEARHAGAPATPSRPPSVRRAATRRAELVTLAEIGRAIVQAQLDEDELCALIYRLAGRVAPTDNFQLGLFENGNYCIRVWVRDGQRQEPATFPLKPGQGIIGWLAESHQPLLVNDFETEMDALPARPTYISQHPPRSAIFLPLVVGETAIGALSIQSLQPSAFSDEDLRLLTILANQSAAALNNARLYNHNRRRVNDLLAVAEVGGKINSILDLDELLTQVVALIQARFGYYHVQIFLVERGSDRALFKASTGHQLSEKWREEARAMFIGREGIIGWVAEHGEPLIANDVAAEPRYIPDDPRLLPDTRAEIAVALIVEHEVVGVLDAQSTRRDAFGQDDLFILRTLADQVAVAVSSARAYEAQREEAWITTVMLQVAEATNQASSVIDVLDVAVRVTAMLAGVAAVAVWLWDDDGEVFEFGAGSGLLTEAASEDDALVEMRLAPGDWPALDELRRVKTASLIEAAAGALPAGLAHRYPGDALALLPMLNKGQVFGVMTASFDREQMRGSDERRLSMLTGIAHQIAAAVDNSRLSALREEEVWTSTVLLQVADAIRRLQPVDITLEQVTQLVPELTGVARCAALLLDGDGYFQVKTVHALRDGLARPYASGPVARGELPLLDDACRSGQPLVVNDTLNNPRVPDGWRARFGSRTILVVPLLVADEPIGALVADDTERTHLFNPRGVRIVTGIANQAAIAIENARLQVQEAEAARIGRELELARDIQAHLLPAASPLIPGYQVGYRWRAAREIGGDFFDFIPLAADRWGLVVADVSDKGIPAALYMVFARTLLRAASLNGHRPVEALQQANRLMLADSQAEMFVTAYYSLLDAAEHTLTYASAGHNLALYAPVDGSPPVAMTTRGLALGILEDVEFEQLARPLAPGDVVLFYTDGLVEALNTAGEPFGDERLAALLHAERGYDAETIAGAIEDAVWAFAGDASQYDDLTLVVLKREMD
jgi:phosphoserine phosphatase RsbU/P